MEHQGVVFAKTSLIRGKSTFWPAKLYKYFAHYISVLRNYFTYNYQLVYIHFLTHHIPVLLLMLPFKKHPIVVNFHGSDLHMLLHSDFMDFWAKRVLKKIDLLIVPTNYFKDRLLGTYPFLNEDRVFVSPSGGIDGDIFYPMATKKTSTKLTLGFVSRLTEEKGWTTFLEALVCLRDANFDFEAIIGGQGKDQELVQKRIAQMQLGELVRYIGFVPQNQLSEVYNKLDLYIFPTYRDSLGLTGLEAMSCGIPVIASRIEGGPTSYITHGKNGFLFTPKDSKELCRSIIHFYELGPAQKNEMAGNALSTASTYERHAVAENLKKRLELFLEVPIGN